MPVLLLFRHAKSAWDDPTLSDFERPLAPRGIKAARLMGAEMAKRGHFPDTALVSTATRAQQTWSLAALAIEKAAVTPVETQYERGLYLAAPVAILAYAGALPASTETALIVGHNPGMESLALSLSGPSSDPAALGRMTRKFPTAALAVLVFDGDWSELKPGCARLTFFVRPRDILE